MDTKTAILNSAEKLFAEKGFDCVSIRDIINTAEVNIAAVNYHFGNKQELILAVISRRISCVNNVRLENLKRLKSEYKIVPVEKLIHSFISPAFAMGREDEKNGSVFMQVLGRAISSSSTELKTKVISLFQNVIQEFLTEFIKSMPETKPEVVASRFYFCIGSMAHMLMNQDMPGKITALAGKEIDYQQAEAELEKFLLGGLNA